MEPAILFHHAVHRSLADVDTVLLKREAYAIHAVVAIIRMLRKNCVDLDRKKLTAAVPAPVSKPPLITGLAQDYMRGLQARIEQAYGKPVPRITPHVYAIPSVPTFNRRGLT